MNAEELMYKTLNSDEAPAFLAESFVNENEIPSKVWIYNNTHTENVRADDKIYAQEYEFCVAYYSDDPRNMREIVFNKCNELEAAGFVCSGAYRIPNRYKPSFGLGFIATIQIKI